MSVIDNIHLILTHYTTTGDIPWGGLYPIKSLDVIISEKNETTPYIDSLPVMGGILISGILELT